MKNKIILAVGLLVLVVIALVAFNSRDKAPEEQPVQVPTEDALDFVLAFYDEWLTLYKTEGTDPYESELFKSSKISETAREELRSLKVDATNDPIICDNTAERFATRVLFKLDTSAEIIMLPRGTEGPRQGQAIVTLAAVDGQWQIGSIKCNNGDVAPEREYTFDYQGYLLKSVPPPYETGKWHLVYAQDGVMGFVAPLFFNEESICIATDGTESVCTPDSFNEATQVTIKGNMSETGAEVKRLQF